MSTINELHEELDYTRAELNDAYKLINELQKEVHTLMEIINANGKVPGYQTNSPKLTPEFRTTIVSNDVG
jgi:hypothetical protein